MGTGSWARVDGHEGWVSSARVEKRGHNASLAL